MSVNMLPKTNKGERVTLGCANHVDFNYSGFTLIELAVVLFIIVVVLSIATPRLIRYVYSKAVFSKTSYFRIMFDLKNNEYWIETCTPSIETNSCEWHKDPDTLGKPERLPHGIKFEDIVVNNTMVSKEATDVAIQFYPQGYMPYTIIHLEDDKKDVYSLEVNPFTGQVAIYDKYYEPEKS
jgi:prepilin-type N-terminal cleavage/methylation domain-containing protein